MLDILFVFCRNYHAWRQIETPLAAKLEESRDSSEIWLGEAFCLQVCYCPQPQENHILRDGRRQIFHLFVEILWDVDIPGPVFWNCSIVL